MKTEVVKKYLERLKYFDGIVTVDHLAGFENKNALVPDHLRGTRFFNYRQGQNARRLRDRDITTHILSYDNNGQLFSKSYSGRLSHNRIIDICYKAGALNEIEAIITDHATGMTKTRRLGY
jgi:hypothetical protein